MAPNVQHFIRELDLNTGKLYDTQRNAILARVRIKWPSRFDLKKTEQERLELTHWIKPVVLEFLSEKNLQPHELDDRLATYTDWAFRLNDWSREEMGRSQRLSGLGGDNKSDSEENTVNTSISTVQDNNLQQIVPEFTQTARDDIGTILTSESTPGKFSTSSQVTIWDDVELAVDAAVLGLGVIWLPLIQLKPVKGQACHWSDFTFARLISSLEEETGTRIDTSACEFVYGDIKFTNPGAWNIVLKRFGESAHGQGNILRLTVQCKQQARTPTDSQEREADVRSASGESQQSRSNRARSRFEGLLGDNFNESEEVNTKRSSERDLPQVSAKRTKLGESNW